jgi:two-component system, OmpR family, response regulator
MKVNQKVKVFLVDDDILYLKMLEFQFLQEGDFIIETFVNGELCIQNLSSNPDIIILDYLLDEVDKFAMNGIETLDKILAYDPNIAVIMLSGQDKIEVAVDCMHHKAVDYVVKSETAFLRIKKIISSLFEYKKITKQLNWYMDRM